MRVLFLDCPHGATSAMIIAALSDAGLKPSALEWELSSLDIGDFHMHFDRKERDGRSGIAFTLHAGATHGHGGDCCGDHPHDDTPPARRLADLRELIGTSDLSERVRQTALGIFQRLADAEAAAQQTTPEAADLHAGGTLEGIAHVVITAIGLEVLGIERTIITPLREGKGWVQNSSGSSAIPSPVTLALLSKAPLTLIDEPFQLLAPLPAAILAGIATAYGERPAFTGETMIGYGINPRHFPRVPAIVAAEIGDA